MFSYRKVGGLHWISLGRLRIAWCIKRQSPLSDYVSQWQRFEAAETRRESLRLRGISKNAKGELRSFTIF